VEQLVALLSGLLLLVAAKEYSWWAPLLAGRIVCFAALLCPRRERAMRREEWFGDLGVCRELQVPGLMFALGVLVAGLRLRIHSLVPAQPSLKTLRRARLALAVALIGVAGVWTASGVEEVVTGGAPRWWAWSTVVLGSVWFLCALGDVFWVLDHYRPSPPTGAGLNETTHPPNGT
jgi:hypothetical protein